MKRLYTLGVVMAMGAFGTQSMAQVSQLQQAEIDYPMTSDISETATKKATKKDYRKGATTTYFSEDFSNGLDGQGANGAWTIAGDQGELWFQSFAAGEPDGYSSTAAILGGTNPLYNNQIPNYFGTRTTLSSPTAANGFMMIDGDRFNSTSTTETPGTLTQNPFVAQLISPPMDLSAASEGALLVFNQYVRLCCAAGSFVTVDFTFDAGETWLPFDAFTPFGAVNADLDVEAVFCINELVQNAPDLTAVQLRFNWSGPQSHYFWMVDDISIIEPPVNDITIGTVWYDRFIQAQNEDITAAEYYSTFEFNFTPEYLVKPLQFGAVVSNECSQVPQTNIQLNISVEGPDGEVFLTEVSTDNIASLESGTSDTIWTEAVFPQAWMDDVAATGQYLVSYEVVQEQEDERPEDNIGAVRGFNITNDAENDGFAIMQNGGQSYNGAFTDDGQDVIFGTAYTFPEPQVTNTVITHVEAVFLFSAGFAESVPGEIVYFNVRDGAILDEDPEDENAPVTGVFFDQANPLTYEDPELEYTIGEDDLWTTADGFPQNWVSFELPSPILIETDRVYQAEFRVPAGETGIAFAPISTLRTEPFSTFFYRFADNAWLTAGGGGTASIRFRTTDASAVADKLTYESGIKLTQNYPNPFNVETRIQYQLDETSNVRLNVYDISGKLMFSDNLGLRTAGTAYVYDFQRRNLAAGVYTYTLATDNAQVTRKMIVE
jgi:hypothetical protein